MQQAPAVARSESDVAAFVREGAVLKVRHDDGTKTVNGYHVYHKLGEGGFAKVKLCKDCATGEVFAMKVFRKGRLRRQRQYLGNGEGTGMKVNSALDKVYNEVRLLKRIWHENCTKLYGVFDEEEQEGKMYIVIGYAALGASMEWNTQAHSYFVPATGGLVPEPVAKSYVRDTAAGLAYIHALHIAHRDVKPQNLLLSSTGAIVLSDFGVATELPEDGLVEDTQGTFHFYAPEMCATGYAGHEARKVDVWALGVSMWVFLFGTLPFFSEDLANLFTVIAAGRYSWPSSPVTSDAARSLLGRLLDQLPANRLSACELTQDDWCRAPPHDALLEEIAKIAKTLPAV